ncbi:MULTISPECIES: bifunctional hydroxymethylpyrimidine kinase/phosphomethylpyrimidine kinase [Micrococcaceae]|uniref:bifunctional hydroxymethylpyrimidine kinase/phosphomethylpyrimidine kinase n=1 Tax=unclassified Kocuria TaxID=2649579 RepID=UPI001012FB95|nr:MULTISPECIES: bifunctional hydroxymethylpyrimidine kinase/phosphomethylpyrimidine kinase [unclassified Kocuria]
MRPPVAMTIAGSDPSGGAGIQADLKTFSAIGAYGCACMTSLTSQNTVGVRGVHNVPEDFVVSQVEAVIDDVPVDSTKIGMLGTGGVVRLLARLMNERRESFGTVILDPVMVATSGDTLLSQDADAAIRADLLPLADLITPNLPESARLLGRPDRVADSLEDMRSQAEELLELGPRAVLLKGGHLRDGEAVDVLAISPRPSPVEGAARTPAAEPTVIELTAPRVETRNTHGTGCTLSSAIAAFSARWAVHQADSGDRGIDDAALMAATRDGKNFLTRALVDGACWELSRFPDQGHGPVNHLAQILR